MKKAIVFLLIALMLTAPATAVEKLEDEAITIGAPSAVLVEKSTGTVIYEKNAHEQRSPASVTKVMTLLLVVEAIDSGVISLDDMVTASAYACSMGGSQVWLKENEQMSVSDMLKCVAVVSANDCAVALAEHISGSEEAFVAQMNARALELGMTETNFTNCTGLLENNRHYTSAYDISLMSRELISHDMIKEYSTIWMDSVRDGASELVNTNRLVRFYDGTTGLKTGYTSTAGHCLAATAERGGVEYIAVIMNGSSSDERFESAKTLLNYAFANYSLVSLRPESALPPVYVELGIVNSVQPMLDGRDAVLLNKSAVSGLEYSLELPESVSAPIAQGEQLGRLVVSSGGEQLAEVPLVATNDVPRMGVWKIFTSLVWQLFGAN